MTQKKRGKACEICGEEFHSRQAAAVHLHQAHGVYRVTGLAVRTNRCIYCQETFASRSYAEQHVERAMRKGECPRTNKKAWEYEAEGIEEGWRCSFCSEVLVDWDEYRQHVAEHAPRRKTTADKYYRISDGMIREAWELSGIRRRIRGKRSVTTILGDGGGNARSGADNGSGTPRRGYRSE